MKYLGSTLALAGALTVSPLGCKNDKATPERGETAKDTSGVPDCDAYIDKLERCIQKMPEAQRVPWQRTLDTLRGSLKAGAPAERQQLADGCRTGMATLESSGSCK
jgi:hypothetical protein